LRSKESSTTKHGRKKINSLRSSTSLKSRQVFIELIILAALAFMGAINLQPLSLQLSSKYMDLIDLNITCALRLEEDRQLLRLAPDLFRWRTRQK
jgi:hypothetical protein